MIKNRYNLQKLMTFYIKVMVITITLFAIIMSGFKVRDIMRDMNQAIDSGMNRTTLLVDLQQGEANQLVRNLIQNPAKVKNLQKFFQLNSADYLTYSQNNSGENDFYYIPHQVSEFMQSNNADKVTFSLNQENQAIVATQKNPGGVRVDSKKLRSSGLYYGVPLINDATFQSFGSVIVNFHPGTINDSLHYSPNHNELQVFVLTDIGRLRYSYNSNLSEYSKKALMQDPNQNKSVLKILHKGYFIRTQEAANGDQIIAMIPKNIIYKRITCNVFLLLLGAALIDIFLWWSLKYIN